MFTGYMLDLSHGKVPEVAIRELLDLGWGQHGLLSLGQVAVGRAIMAA